MESFTLRNADSAKLERMVRDPGRTTQVSLSSQELALLLDTYVLLGMTLSLLLAFTLQRTEQRAIRRTDDTRVDGCLSGRRKILGLLQIFRSVREYPGTKSELRAHQMARKLRSASLSPHKIRAELSSNGSQLKLRTAGLTPRFPAELS